MLGEHLCSRPAAPGGLKHPGYVLREFLQYLIYTVVHCYHHSVCVCACVSCKNTDPEGFCIPEEFQNQLMAVVVGERELGVVLSRVFVQRWHAPAVCLERKFAKFFLSK